MTKPLSETDKAKLAADPNLFLETAIKEYVANSPNNRLPAYDNDPVVDEPLVGFADGHDPIFQEFKKETVVGEFHFTPEEALATYLKRQKKAAAEKTSSLSVISIIFTPTKKTRLSNRPQSVMASSRWQYAFIRGIKLMEDTLQYLVSTLEALGYRAVAPMCTRPELFLWQLPSGGPTSDWSEKHVAYAAGLGTFGLNGGIITTQGAALQLGSVITELALKPAPRPYDSYQAYCLYYRNGSCGRCVQRCPSGAITAQGYDSKKCFFRHEVDLPRMSRELGREAKGGEHFVCALCQTKVPCESRIPPDPPAEK